MRNMFFLVLVLIFSYSFSQEIEEKFVDSNYLEDQLYIGLSYNIILNSHSISNKEIRHGLFSNTFDVGFIRDIPLNERRNIGIGVGMGYSYNNYYTNIKIYKDFDGNVYSELIELSSGYYQNKISLYQFNFPLEFRYRTSDPSNMSFFKIYVGILISYTFMEYAEYSDNNIDVRYYDINAANEFQYAVTSTVGYGSWNLYILYNLSTLFSPEFKLDDHQIEISNLSIGLRYFVL